jgi:hypothetical protein
MNTTNSEGTEMEHVTLADLENIVVKFDNRKRLEAANRIINAQCAALAAAHDALLEARVVITRHMLGSYEPKDDGKSVGGLIDRAIHQIVCGAP